MGIIIVGIAAVVEATLAIASRVSRRDHARLRGATRMGACAAFALLVLLSVVEWSARWYALAALLVVWALRGAWTLRRASTLRRGEEPEPAPGAGRLAVRVVGAVLLVLLAVTPALVFPPYRLPEPTGRHAVASEIHTYGDTRRVERYAADGGPRRVTVEFWYPEDAAGPFPLVIFSHGALGIRHSNLSLYRELASHGYVVGAVDHPYHAFWTTDATGQRTFLSLDYLADLQREDARADRLQSYAYYQEWMAIRMGDINLVIDTVLAQAGGGAGIYRLVDSARIGVMGHSLGGAAALGIGRQRGDVGAVLALEAPFMYDIEGVSDGEFLFTEAAYPVPVLNVYSDASWGHLAKWPQYARNHALRADPGASAFSVYLDGVGHLALTDLALTSPFLVRVLDTVPTTRDRTATLLTINRLSLAFFDRYLKDEGDASGPWQARSQPAIPDMTQEWQNKLSSTRCLKVPSQFGALFARQVAGGSAGLPHTWNCWLVALGLAPGQRVRYNREAA